MELLIRNYSPSDFGQLVDVYVSAFAEPPWDEYKKCAKCGINYGIRETSFSPERCKKCKQKLDLVEFWSVGDIKKDIDFALKQRNSIALVALNDKKLVGIAWGYKLPFEKFPFLSRSVGENCVYLDDIAVRGDSRKAGVGTRLGEQFIFNAKSEGMGEAILRTDSRNNSSVALFSKLGFRDAKISDP